MKIRSSTLATVAAVALIVIGAGIVLLIPGSSEATAPSASGLPGTWAMKGLLTDACQCQVFCPCEMAEKPTYGHCKDTAILHIETGHYDTVGLDGQRVVVVSRSPDDERLVDTVGRLVFAHMYVSDEATDEQAEALGELARRVFGTWVDGKNVQLSPNETLEQVPMEVTIERHRHKVKIPGKLDLDVEALVGWDGENPVAIRNGPAAGPGHGDILVARSHAYRFQDHDLDWDFPGRSASMRVVDLEGEIGPLPEASPEVAPTSDGPEHDHAAHDHSGHAHH